MGVLVSGEIGCVSLIVFFFKQKTAYEMRISDWSSDVCSSDLLYASEPSFYKAVQFSVYNGNSRDLRLALLGPRHMFLEDLVREAIDLGAISGDVNIVAFGSHLKIGRASCRESVCQYV